MIVKKTKTKNVNICKKAHEKRTTVPGAFHWDSHHEADKAAGHSQTHLFYGMKMLSGEQAAYKKLEMYQEC